ncbi:DUF3010 family protein [Roseomonas genomospecies 6]|uniref:DUF3010 family protein n=2 Tax=Roseomonas genomospecies 6 TaxID=214106 RepID=A0A9W7NJC9_9PROT|nr:DUF3010 family protein [Roseomonas genomospecies 6]
MHVCGIDIRGKDIILVLGEASSDGLKVKALPRPKITIADADNAEQLRAAKTTLEGILREHAIERIVIKERQKSGMYKPGAASYKLETIVQLNDVCRSVEFLHTKTATKILRDADVEPPTADKQYCEEALLIATALALRETA